MKIRHGFVSNSSSSSFRIFTRGRIEGRSNVIDYIKTHDECTCSIRVGESDCFYEHRVYFDVKDILRKIILENEDFIGDFPVIERDFDVLDEVVPVTEEMVGGEIVFKYFYSSEYADQVVSYIRFCYEGAPVLMQMFGEEKARELNEKYELGIDEKLFIFYKPYK